jgi:hypothetical protein
VSSSGRGRPSFNSPRFLVDEPLLEDSGLACTTACAITSLLASEARARRAMTSLGVSSSTLGLGGTSAAEVATAMEGARRDGEGAAGMCSLVEVEAKVVRRGLVVEMSAS